MRSFTSEGYYDMSLGRIWFTRAPETVPRDDGWLIGEEVLLDERQVTVKGVESFALTVIRQGDPIGLLIVEDLTQTPQPD